MPNCQFTTKYYDYEIRNSVEFPCPELPLVSGRCIFHDNNYCLRDKTYHEIRQRIVLARLKRKVNHAISNNEPLLCIGFHLPDFSLSDLGIGKEYTKPVYFNGSQFFGKVHFSRANFQGEADFYETNFQGKANFSNAEFKGGANFDRANFQGLASFILANIQGVASFAVANFQGEVDFTKANFQGFANFMGAKFQVGVYFNKAKFKQVAKFKVADFTRAKFHGDAAFNKAVFQGEALFFVAEFYGITYFSADFNGKTQFNYAVFEGKEKVIFDMENFSNVSFINTEITGVSFSDRARWGEKKVEFDKFWRRQKVKEDKFKTVDERLLEEKIKEKDSHTTKDFNLGSIKAVYRNLRENYENRMRYDEAGQFFVREMELKRKYREVPSKEEADSIKIVRNRWFRRNLFSLTGWYYHLSRYGESIWRPTLAGLVIVILSTLFWLIQVNPIAEPSFTNTVGFANAGNLTHLQRAFERSMADFLPLLPMGGEIKVGLIDYIIKIVGGAVTFGLIAIALRRRFERRYRH